MNSTYMSVSNNLANNFSVLKSEFKWDHDLSKWLVAVAYATQNKPLDVEVIKNMKEYIKKNTGLFSPFRSTSLFPISALLCLDNDNPESRFNEMMDNYDVVKKVGFKQTNYLPVTLYTIGQVYSGSNYSQHAEQAFSIYEEMKNNHPILTGGDDYALTVLLVNEQGKLDKIEESYKALKLNGFSVANGLQMMSHILTFSDESVSVLAERCRQIAEELKRNKLKVYPDYYASIALIALTGVESAVVDLIEVAKYLKTQRQAKWLNKGMVVMLAAAIVTTTLIEKSEDQLIMTSLKVSIQVIIAAQQAAMIAAITASSAAAASSH